VRDILFARVCVRIEWPWHNWKLKKVERFALLGALRSHSMSSQKFSSDNPTTIGGTCALTAPRSYQPALPYASYADNRKSSRNARRQMNKTERIGKVSAEKEIVKNRGPLHSDNNGQERFG
jgi:hypothetical protein